MINEAEHGPDSASILITTDKTQADKVAELLPGIVQSLPEPRRSYCEKVFSNYGGIILVKDMDEALDITNAYAVEHMLVRVSHEGLGKVYTRVRNGSEILMGYNAIVLQNFGGGVNAVLPTGGKATTQSCTSVWSFLKRSSLSYVTKQGYETLKQQVIELALHEGFPGHAMVLQDHQDEPFRDELPVGLPFSKAGLG
jgi:histidinol dehydrogenase